LRALLLQRCTPNTQDSLKNHEHTKLRERENERERKKKRMSEDEGKGDRGRKSWKDWERERGQDRETDGD